MVWGKGGMEGGREGIIRLYGVRDGGEGGRMVSQQATYRTCTHVCFPSADDIY